MGKPRVRGQHAKIYVQDQAGVNIEVGEISKVSVKDLGELKKSRAIGDAAITATKTFEGYDLSFEGGKVDWKLAQLLHLADDQIFAGKRSPYFNVQINVEFYDGAQEIYQYPDVTIHGYALDVDANDELTEKFEGFCGMKRTASPSGAAQTSVTSMTTLITDIITASNAKDGTDRG